MRTLRAGAAYLVWMICAVAALVLAGAALLVGLRVDESHQWWGRVVDAAEVLDLPVVGRGSDLLGGVTEPVLGWGLAALAWLLVGRVLVALIRPRSA